MFALFHSPGPRGPTPTATPSAAGGSAARDTGTEPRPRLAPPDQGWKHSPPFASPLRSPLPPPFRSLAPIPLPPPGRPSPPFVVALTRPPVPPKLRHCDNRGLGFLLKQLLDARRFRCRHCCHYVRLQVAEKVSLLRRRHGLDPCGGKR